MNLFDPIPTFVFCIATERQGPLADELFLFSAINLLNHTKTIERLGYKVANSKLSVVVHCQGDPNNANAAVAATKVRERFKPKIMILMGIAAGRRGHCNIGDVVIPRAVVDYTTTVAENGQMLPRTLIPPLPYPISQTLKAFRFDEKTWYRIFKRIFRKQVKIPKSLKKDYAEEFEKSVSKVPKLKDGVIASADILLRDEEILETLASAVHQQILVGEMEAAGFVTACSSNYPAIPWFVVRGVSDFGDKFKHDLFHELASCSAASYLGYFLQCGLDIRLVSAGGTENKIFSIDSIREILKTAQTEFNKNNFQAAAKISEEASVLAKAAGDEDLARKATLQVVRALGEDLMGCSPDNPNFIEGITRIYRSINELEALGEKPAMISLERATDISGALLGKF